MLDKYRNDISIAGITADYKLSSVNSSYYGFINYPLIWGWATWKRAWDGYSLSFKNIESQKLYSCFPDMPDNQKFIGKIILKKFMNLIIHTLGIINLVILFSIVNKNLFILTQI